jgi:glycosyltransferase involved in cell wall biosynthesis
MEQPIIWLSQPKMGSLIGQFHERLTIYHVVDEYTAYHGVTTEMASWIRLQEKQLMARVDLVIVVSSTLWEAKRPYNPHTYWVPNGVDLVAFNRALTEKTPPADLNAIPEPRLVYAGLIGVRLDLTLLLAVARRHPDWSLVFIGQVDDRGCEDELANLQSLPNVHFLGLKPASVVPRYLLACQVCLLPYRRSEESRHIDPIKLYEGLASGKPIVSTPIPAVLPYGDLIWLASDDSEFEAAVQEALAERDDSRAAQRRSLAAEHTWEKRVEQISTLIQSRLRDNKRVKQG